MDYVMTQTRNEAYMAQFTPEQLEYFYGFPAWVVAAWAIAVWGGLLGAILLLLRRRLAVPVFLVSFIAMVITTIYNYLLSDGMRVMGDAATLAFTGAIFFIALLLWLYARAMAQRGVLG
jgi:ribose/xylose/arabinose/galactoside ABC-type transport system permease subunit